MIIINSRVGYGTENGPLDYRHTGHELWPFEPLGLDPMVLFAFCLFCTITPIGAWGNSWHNAQELFTQYLGALMRQSIEPSLAFSASAKQHLNPLSYLPELTALLLKQFSFIFIFVNCILFPLLIKVFQMEKNESRKRNILRNVLIGQNTSRQHLDVCSLVNPGRDFFLPA